MHQCRKVDVRRGVRPGVLDHVVSWAKPSCPEWMDRATYDQLPDQIEVRELRVRVEQAGFRVVELVLVTTLLDATAYTGEEVAGLYSLRWGIELDLCSIEVDMQKNVLRYRSLGMVEEEIWANLLGYDAVRCGHRWRMRRRSTGKSRVIRALRGRCRRCVRSRGRSGRRSGLGVRSCWGGLRAIVRIAWVIVPVASSPGRRNAAPSHIDL